MNLILRHNLLMYQLKIRRYNSKDHDVVWELHKLGLVEIGGMPSKDNPWDQDIDNIEKVYLQGGDFIVGELDGQIVAMAAFKRVDSDTAELKRMRVHPDFQRRGFGQSIVQELEKTAKRMGYKKMVLNSSPRWTKAQKFYRKMGYKETRRGVVYGKFFVIFYEKYL